MLIREMKINESENYDRIEKLEKERHELFLTTCNNQKDKTMLLENIDHLIFSISVLEKTVERMKQDSLDQTQEDSVIMDTTVTNHNLPQFTKSFSILHHDHEKTIQQEIDELSVLPSPNEIEKTKKSAKISSTSDKNNKKSATTKTQPAETNKSEKPCDVWRQSRQRTRENDTESSW